MSNRNGSSGAPQVPSGIFTFPLPLVDHVTKREAFTMCCLVDVPREWRYYLYGWHQGRWQTIVPITGFLTRGVHPKTGHGYSEEGFDYVMLRSAGLKTTPADLEAALISMDLLRATSHIADNRMDAPPQGQLYELHLKPAQIAHQCAECLVKEVGLSPSAPRFKRCSGCEIVYYCSEKCQKASWKRSRNAHKLECAALRDKDFIIAYELLNREQIQSANEKIWKSMGLVQEAGGAPGEGMRCFSNGPFMVID